MQTIKKGATDRSVELLILDATTGAKKNDVVYNSAGIDLWYRRDGAAKVSITEATLSALTDAHSDGGFLLIGDGEYRLDLPDAAFATGANKVTWGGTVTGGNITGGAVHLVDYDPQDTVRLGLTALPNAAADAAGGLPISDAGGLDLDARLDAAITTRASATALATADGKLDTIQERTDNLPDDPADQSLIIAATDAVMARLGAPVGASMSADIAAVLAAVLAGEAWRGTLAGIASGTVTLGSGHGIAADARVFVILTAGTNAKGRGRFATYSGSGDVFDVDPAWDADGEPIPSGSLTAIVYPTPSEPVTNLPSVALGDVGIAAKLNDTLEDDGGTFRFTSNALEQAPTGGSAPTAADIRAEIDANSTQLQAILADTAAMDGRLPSDPADQSLIIAATDAILAAITALNNLSAANVRTELATELGRIDVALSTLATANNLTTVDTVVDAIKAVTDALVTMLEDVSGYRFTAAAVSQAPSGTGASAASIRAEMDSNSTRLAAIDGKTTNLPTDPADQSLLIAAADAIAAAIAALNNLSAAQVRTELSTELGRIDVAVGTRASQSSADAIVSYIDTEITALLAAVAALPDASAVATAVRSNLATVASAEPTAVPATNAPPEAKLAWLFNLARNAIEQTATEQRVKNDAGATIAVAAVSDGGGTLTRAEYAAP